MSYSHYTPDEASDVHMNNAYGYAGTGIVLIIAGVVVAGVGEQQTKTDNQGNQKATFNTWHIVGIVLIFLGLMMIVPAFYHHGRSNTVLMPDLQHHVSPPPPCPPAHLHAHPPSGPVAATTSRSGF